MRDAALRVRLVAVLRRPLREVAVAVDRLQGEKIISILGSRVL